MGDRCSPLTSWVGGCVCAPVRIGKWPSAARDFVVLSSRARDPDGTFVVAATSTTHPEAPEQRGIVRAHIRTSGFVIHDVTPSGSSKPVTKLTYIVQLDPGGWVPAYLANAVAINQPLCIAGIRETTEARAHLGKPPVTADPLFASGAAAVGAGSNEKVATLSAHEAVAPPLELPSLASVGALPTAVNPATAAAALVAPGQPDTALPVLRDHPMVSATAAAAATTPAAMPMTTTSVLVDQATAGGELQPYHMASAESSLVVVSATAQQITGSLRSAALAADSLVQLFGTQQSHIQRMHALLAQYLEIEQRVRDAEHVWDQRLRRMEGPLMDVDWLRAWRNIDWRAAVALVAVLVGWPVIANLVWSLLRRWLTQRRHGRK